jgi:RHS repeat-associated protein
MGGSFARTGLPAALASATYDANNRVANWGGTALSHDANGNLLGFQGKTYSWNSRDQLASISGAASASFAYDAAGRREGRTISGTGRQFLYDGLNPVQERSGGSVSANILTGLGIDEFFKRTEGSNVEHYLADALGSTLRLTNNSAAKVVDYTYEAYGETSADASSGNAFQYTGRENDGTGLYYYRARYYDPGLKQFIQEDPIGINGGLNLYVYVRGDPLRYNDPLGLQATGGGSNGQSGGGSSYFDCLANCIRANDPMNYFFGDASGLATGGLTALGGTFPKSWVGLPSGLGGASPLTTIPSAAAHAAGGGAAGTAGSIARGVGRLFSPVWIGYGLGMFAVESMCAIACAQDTCMY